jgi:uncharacterized repeat protein (TIGR01451 family)
MNKPFLFRHYAQALIFAFAAILAVTSAWAQTCAIPGRDAIGSLTGTVNSYYPPSANGTYGPASTNIPLGTRVGAAISLQAGDLVVVMQMQCATLNTTNTNNYGAGNGTGRGYTDPGSSCLAGQYEYVRAGAGSSDTSLVLNTPLVNTYINDATTATNRRTFQLIRVPQHASATLTGQVTSPYWNGNTGGVVVLDVAGQLAWGGQTINTAGRGFRGGGGTFWNGTADATTPPDYVDTFAGAVHAMKGEGIAGTPRIVYDTDSNTRSDLGATWGGYANGDVGRGAPGNAGGGGNNRDGARDNGGGGGGGNGGIGGFGAFGWKGSAWAGTFTVADFDLRGIGGAAFAAPAANRVVMGGGGGASSPNNSGNPPTVGIVDGGNGGGIVIVRAGSMVGNGTVTVAGRAAVPNPNNDGSGGGGAGGSVVLMSAAGSVGGVVNVIASGGTGGDSFLAGTTAHAGGGGGAGGIVITSGAPTVNVVGAANGTTNTVDNPPFGANHGATPGGNGSGLTGQGDSTFTTRPSAQCLPNLTVTKTTTSPTVSVAGATTVGYLITITNSGGMAIGADIVDNALPPGWTLASTSSVTFSLSLSPTVWGGFIEGATPGQPAVVNSPGTLANLTVNGTPAGSPTWSSFAIPGIAGGVPGSVVLSYVVNVPATAPVGCYHNPAGIRYLDPTRNVATNEVTPQAQNISNRAGALVGGTANTSYQTPPGPSSVVAGSNYSGLAGGPTGEDVCLQGDLSVAKSNPGTITAGQTVTYTLTPTNAGRQIRDLTYAADQATDASNASTATRVLSASAVRVVDTLPTGVTLNGTVTAAGWTCSAVGQVITCDRTTAAVPITATTALTPIAIPVRVTNAACAGPITNTVAISGFQAPYSESTPGNNSASVASPLNCSANLSVTKNDGVTTTLAGSSNTYTVTFVNAGPASADGAAISDAPSAGLSSCTVLSCTPTGGAVCPASFTNFFTSNVTVPSLPSSGQLQVLVRCGVTASGL